MKRIVFSRNRGVGYQTYTETIEFDNDVTEEEINEAYKEWVWEEVGDEFTWYEEGEEEQS